MSRISNWMWIEVVLLIGLFVALFAGFITAKQFATYGIGVLVIFALPDFLNLANTHPRKDENG